MNNGSPDWLNSFSNGFNSSGDSSGLWWGLGLLLAIAGVIWLLYLSARNERARQARRGLRAGAPSRLAQLRPVPAKLNPLQQKIIYEMIDEFREHEASAQA